MSPIQDSNIGWQLTTDVREPILALKLYAMFALVSALVPVAFLLRNWIALRPFKHPDHEKCGALATLFRRQANGLQRWMGLNALAWLAVTAAGLSNGLNGVSVSKRIGFQVIAFALNDLTYPLQIFLCIMMALYVARWHILWRADRIDRSC